MKRFLTIILAFLLIIPAGMTVTSAEPVFINILGDKIENPAFELNLSVSQPICNPGEVLEVSITVNKIVPKDGLALIRFLLYYDTSKVEPVIKSAGDSININMNTFLKTAPDIQNWDDGVCKLDEAKGIYDVSFCASDISNASKLAKEDGSVVVVIPFFVKASAIGKIPFQIPNGENGARGCDINLQKVYGNGGYILPETGNGAIPLTGAVSLSGTCSPDQVLSADATMIKPSGSKLLYFWYRNDRLVKFSEENTYKINSNDVGYEFYVVVYGYKGYIGSMISYPLKISDSIKIAPPVPALYKKDQNSVTLWPYSGCQYKIESGTWQDSNVFSGLTSGQTYKFYVRYKVPVGSQAAPESEPFSVKLDRTIGVGDDINNELTYCCLNGLPEELTTDDVYAIMGNTALLLDYEGNEVKSGSIVGTGMILFNGTFFPIVIKGDLNGDGVVDSVDCLLLKKSIIGTETLENEFLLAACVNGETTPDSTDYLKIKKYILGNSDLYN